MKIKNLFLTFLKLTTLMATLQFSSTCFAKEISLYDQPKSDAKIVGKVDLAAGFIPIYTPKEGEWVKIGDPKNGNVGWVKSKELNNINSTQTSFTFTQSYINDNNKSPMTYRIIQFGEPSKLSSEQTQSMIKQMQIQQQSLQKSMQNMMHDMDQFFYDDWHFKPGNFPLLMPVVFIPVQNTTNTSQQIQPNKRTTPSVSSPPKSNNQQQSNIKDKK